jgi:hypothetical protein
MAFGNMGGMRLALKILNFFQSSKTYMPHYNYYFILVANHQKVSFCY